MIVQRPCCCPPTCGCCCVEVAAELVFVDACHRSGYKSQRWRVITLYDWGSVFHCLNLSPSLQCERCLCGFSANDEKSVCEPPSPTSPSPPPTPHHMMAWVGLPLWVTQLWGAMLVRPLSPVSEPRLMTASDDPVFFPRFALLLPTHHFILSTFISVMML